MTKKFNSSLTIEEKYIIACLQAFLDEDAFPPVSASLDWNELYKKINYHLLTGVFSNCLKKSKNHSWPEDITMRLHRARLLIGLRGEGYIRELKNILKGLQTTGQKIIILKGWSLISSLYQNDTSQRISSDVDILIPLEAAELGERLLRDQGYVSDEPWAGFYQQYSINTPFVKQFPNPAYVKNVTIELHWGLMHVPYLNSQINFKGVFQRAVPLEISGESVFSLAPEDHLVYTCAHLLHHRRQFILARWYEFALWLRKYNEVIDWQAVFERAHEWRLSAGIKYTFSVIEQLWPGIIPSERLDQASNLKEGLIERIIHYYEDAGSPNTRPLIIFATLPVAKKLGYLLKLNFPSPKYMIHHYGSAPKGLWPLLYITRYQRFWGFFKQLFSPRTETNAKKD